MKLKIKFDNLNVLMKRMGADSISWKSNQGLSKLELQQLESIEGLEKSLDDIQMDENGLMFINGQPVILFIKETWNTVEMLTNDPGGKGRIRFHVLGDCLTMDQMKRKKRYDRYAFTTNQSGTFTVFAKKERYSSNYKKIKTNLSVCMNCLMKLEYKGSGRNPRGAPNNETREAKNNFNIKEFFENFVQTIISKPKYSEISFPEPGYTKDYYSISKELKKKFNYTCEECKVNLSALFHRHMIHTHHIDGNTGNNLRKNLQVLCICCHAEQGKHILNNKKFKEDYEKCLKLKQQL